MKGIDRDTLTREKETAQEEESRRSLNQVGGDGPWVGVGQSFPFVGGGAGRGGGGRTPFLLRSFQPTAHPGKGRTRAALQISGGPMA